MITIHQIDQWLAADELLQVLPAKTRDQIKQLLFELRREGRVNRVGVTRAARWVVIRPDDSGGNSGNTQ